MKKTTFIGNLVVWGVLSALCAAFQVWYRGADAEAAWELIGSSTLAQGALIFTGPVLAYGVGALAAMLFVWFKKIVISPVARVALRVTSALFLFLLALALVPVFAPDMASAFMLPTAIIVYLALAAPFVIVLLGILYGIGLAGVDEAKKGRLSKYLPED